MYFKNFFKKNNKFRQLNDKYEIKDENFFDTLYKRPD